MVAQEINMYIVLSITIILLILLLGELYYFFPRKNKYQMSFRESMDLSSLPIVTFYQGDKKYNFLLDTGSTMNILDSNSTLEYKVVDEEGGTITGVGKESVTASYAEVSLFYKQKEFSTMMQVTDMKETFDFVKGETGVTLHGILGNNFFIEYEYVLDYYNMVAYPKK